MDVAHSSPNIWPQKNVTNYVTKRRKKKTLFIPQREACVTGQENGRKEGRKDGNYGCGSGAIPKKGREVYKSPLNTVLSYLPHPPVTYPISTG